MGSRLEKNSAAQLKRIANHEFTDEGGEEYEASEFGGFGDYFRRKKLKLQNLDVELRAAAPEKPQIFKGVVAHVNGYTQPPLHVLHRELVQHGAGFLQYLDSKTMATHIIAAAMPPKKAADFTKYRVVKPAWVMDSIKAGKLLPWTDYRVIDDSPRQKTIKFDRGRMFSQATQQSSTGYREQTENSFYTSQLQRSTDRLESQASSSPFQPESAAKPAEPELEDVDDADDMDVDTPVERPLTPEPGAENASATSTGHPSSSEDKPGMLAGGEPRELSKQPPSGKPMTSEEHNAILLSDPKIRKSSTANPDFLKQYYSESRLHHLSTWKAQLKSRLQSLAAEKASAAKRIKRTGGSRRYIMHVDFDSFFCAVSLKHAPDYRDKPAVVAHSTGSGSEIASCNYPARKFGVKNGMWMKRALELCPDLKILPYDFPGYEEASRQFYDAILAVGGVVQSVSIDEALVDITDIVLSDSASKGVGISEGSVWREQERADEIASNLRAEIKKKTDCHVSVGVGGNILLAKIALRKAKPAGQHQIRPEEVLDILGDLKVEDLPGVAYSIGGKLEEIGIKLVKDIRHTSKERLVSVLGPKTGEKLWEYARGIDRTEVGEQPIRKSVSADVSWGIRFVSQAEAEEFVYNLCKELERRLLNEGVKGKNLTMKIMRRALDAPLDPAKHLGHGKCDTFTKSTTFGVATNDAGQIGKEAVAILRSYKFSPGDLRGLGVQMTKLEPLKPSTAPDGSQKKLNFGNLATAPAAKRTKTEPIDDDTSLPNPSRPSGQEFEQDPITVDPLTPRKPKVHPALALARANAADEKANSPLNMMGTQFIIPSNPDPAVLAELPHDIRSRLVNQAKAKRASPAPTAAQSREASPAVVESRSHSPALATTTDEVDIPPDVDPEVFNALPEEMQAEVLASYGRKQQQRQGRIDGHGQTTRPQSARSDRVARLPKEKSTPAKRGGGGGIKGMFSRATERERQQDAEVGLRQTSFTTGGQQQQQQHQQQQAGDDEWIGDLDPDVLAELPEDLRREVVEDHRRQRLAQRPGPSYHQPPAPPRRGGAAADEDDATLPRGQTRLTFPAKPPKAMFTQSGLTSFQEIKDMLGVWHNATKEEGPHRADVEVFERYVKKVIGEERDMEKARKLVKWLEWVVEEEAAGKGKESWREALGSVKVAVQAAMEERGLGIMDFG
ncbi:DNA repair protein rev1 [Madurella mycetomatis]|uniref:DNA repair protein REV1 n=1 Tax=Madurella mycetomatis TaxID=100816 RepID=A0A175VY44_9PEZI|nr:DNA repair protein rev1 [Madurella mycetomatis]KXX77476.1 DNA repair protein rev1 [Madurella mycetomatis]